MKLFAKKSLGQHFLNSTHVLEQIISAANIAKGESVLEIGPGTGILTKSLLESGAKVFAVEKDRRACDFLRGIFSNEIANGQLVLLEGDILEVGNKPIRQVVGIPHHDQPRRLERNHVGSVVYSRPRLTSSFQTVSPRGLRNDSEYPQLALPASFSIVANIPYYITGAILEKFLEKGPRPDRMILLVQKEVADRIIAQDEKESILSISVKAFGTPKIISKVSRGAFTPPPTVDSAILAITDISDNRFTENNVEISCFFRILKAGFAHKRKFLIRNLEAVIDQVTLKNIWSKIGLNEKVRAEDLKLEEWFAICDSQSGDDPTVGVITPS